MIAIRADANKEIGTGHVMRCLAIANELKHKNQEVVFIIADEYSNKLIHKWGFKSIVLKTDYTNMENELSKLLSVLKEIKANCIVVDSYYATDKYFSELKTIVTIVYIDDFALVSNSVDMLINYNISYPKYKQIYENIDAKLLLGTKYTTLREEFSNINYFPINDHIQNILITTGGTDPYKISTDLAESIIKDTKFNNINVHIVVGSFYLNKEELKELSQKFSRIIIHENVKSMSKLMLECDIAVSASGTTLYELCACGVPSVIFGFADNQTLIRKCFGKSGAMIDCGDIRENKSMCINNIIKQLKLLENNKIRENLRNKAKEITDGKGAARIAQNILCLLKEGAKCE